MVCKLRDFDQMHSHQSLILNAVQNDPEINVDVSYRYLRHYVENKKAERARVAAKYYGGDIEKAKHAYLVLTFGGRARDQHDLPPRRRVRRARLHQLEDQAA